MEVQSKGKWTKAEKETAGQLEHQCKLVMGDKKLQWQFNAEGNEAKGKYEVDLKSTQFAEKKVSGDYERSKEKMKYSMNAISGSEYLKMEFLAELKDEQNLNVHYKMSGDNDKLIELNLATDNNQEHYGWNLEASRNIKNKYILSGKIFKPASNKQGVALYLNTPELPKQVTVICTYEKLGEGKGNLQLELAEVFGLDLNSSMSLDVQDLENMNIEVLWDSEKLQLKQYALKLKAEKSKKLQFNLKNAQETILNGVLSQNNRKEGDNKYIIDGQGEVEYRGKKQQGNFQLIRQVYDADTDNEMGVSYALNGQVGAKNAVANLKLTNKEFNMKLSTCEDNKQCSNLQMQSIITADELEASRHSLLVLVDLRELGYPYEFELQSKTQRQGFKAQYNLDAKLISNNQYNYGLIASLSSLGAGQIQLNLPMREILLKLEQQMPANQEVFGHYEQSIALWLNHKKKPDEVTRLKLSGNLQGALDANAELNADASFKLENPQLKRPLTVKGKLIANKAQQSINAEVDMDVFRKAEHKLHMQTELKNAPGSLDMQLKHQLKVPAIDFQYNFLAHATLKHGNSKDWKYTSGLEVTAKFPNTEELKIKSSGEVNAEKLKLQVEALKENLLLLDSNWHKKERGIQSETELQILSQDPLKISTEFELTAAKIQLKLENSIDAEASFKLGKDIIIRLNGDNDVKYVDGRIALDTTNFLQTHYEANLDEIKKVLHKNEEKLQEQTKQGMERMKEKLQKIVDEVKNEGELLVKSLPDLKPLQKSIEKDMEDIMLELDSDPMMKQMGSMSVKLVKSINKFMQNLNEQCMKFYKQARESIQKLLEKLTDISKNSILPLIQDFVSTITKMISKIRIQLLDAHFKLWEIFMKNVEKYAEILKPYGKVLHDVIKTINDANQELIKLINDELKSICNELQEIWQQFQVKNWQPFVHNIQAQWQQSKLAQQLSDIIKQLIEQLQILPQTPESIEFLQQLEAYISQKLNNEPTTTNLDSLVPLAIKAIHSLMAEFTTLIKQHFGLASNFDATQYEPAFASLITHSVQTAGTLPALLTLRFSVVNFLIHELRAGWRYDKLWQQGWYSLTMLQPFDMTARVLNGQQFVTYDGAYAQHKGENCRFILTQDSIDQNFTIVAQQQHNKLRSIALITRNNEMLEVSDNGNLKLNGNLVEYPYHGIDLHAWQLYYTIAIRTQYGVEVMCLKDLSLCHITVNGFYAGRLRGLLGNANREKYDDRILPEGSLAGNTAEFAAAYTLGKCAAIQQNMAEDNMLNEDNEICAELFSWKSTLSAGYLLLDANVYRQGCNLALSAADEEEQQEAKACEWALAYVSALRLHKIPVMLPNNCLKCGKNQPLGHELNVKLPGNKVDILFVIDLETTTTVLDTLVKPLMQDIREAFKARSISDVQIGVIAFNETQRYPALLSSNGGKLNYAGNLADIDLSHSPTVNFCEDCLAQVIGNSKILDVFNYIVSLVKPVLPNAEKTAYQVALKYPFRAQASSVIVTVRNKPLSKTTMLNLLTEIADGLPKLDKTIVHLVAPIPKMAVEGINNEKLIGFNSRLIATLDGKDPKKRSKLQFENNAGIDLILQTGGWIFNTEHLATLKAQEQKKALTQITNTIADTSFKTEQVTECTCETVYGMFAEYKCTVKSTNFVPNKKIKSKK